MTNEERDIIAGFIARVSGDAVPPQTPPQTPWGSSVPATQPQQPALPPVDPEADRFIADQFQQHPNARYRITQLAFVQEHALIEAQNRIRQLQWQLQQMQQAAQQQAQQGHAGGGFFSNLFGGGRQTAGGPSPGSGPWGQPGQGGAQYQQPNYPPPPQPQYPPGYQQGMFQRSGGSGFLGSALTTAAGVAGGIFAADAIRDMFSPREGLMGGGGFGGSPWGGGGEAGAGPWGGDAGAGQGYVDQGQWDQPNTDAGAWNDPGQGTSGAGGGGWDQSGTGGAGGTGGTGGTGGGGGSDDSLI